METVGVPSSEFVALGLKPENNFCFCITDHKQCGCTKAALPPACAAPNAVPVQNKSVAARCSGELIVPTTNNAHHYVTLQPQTGAVQGPGSLPIRTLRDFLLQQQMQVSARIYEERNSSPTGWWSISPFSNRQKVRIVVSAVGRGNEPGNLNELIPVSHKPNTDEPRQFASSGLILYQPSRPRACST